MDHLGIDLKHLFDDHINFSGFNTINDPNSQYSYDFNLNFLNSD